MLEVSLMKIQSNRRTQFLFPTGIYHTPPTLSKKVINNLLQDLEEDIFALSEQDHKGQKWSEENYQNGYTSYSSYDRLDLMTDSFGRLRAYIDAHVDLYLKDLGYECKIQDLTMTQCWGNVMFSHAIHTSHIHPNSVISGTFYVRVPTGASPIQFEDPRLGFFMNSPQVKATAPLNLQRFYKIFSKPGDLVLFESWLRHEVPMMRQKTEKPRNKKKITQIEQNEDPRISISFNYGRK